MFLHRCLTVKIDIGKIDSKKCISQSTVLIKYFFFENSNLKNAVLLNISFDLQDLEKQLLKESCFQ